VERRVVCISHATGAGGEEVGRLVADQLVLRIEEAARVVSVLSRAPEHAAD
jgi:hypothetical protein